MRLALPALAALAAASLGACIPMVVPERCRRDASACLANCPPSSRSPSPLDNDTRSDCERRCHDLARGCR